MHVHGQERFDLNNDKLLGTYKGKKGGGRGAQFGTLFCPKGKGTTLVYIIFKMLSIYSYVYAIYIYLFQAELTNMYPPI